MDSTKDPVNKNLIIEELKACKTQEESEGVINTYYPGWIVKSISSYSSDYSHLENNWNYMCGKFNTTPKSIILVKEIIFDDEHSLIMTICEIMTRIGFCVRRVGEFTECPGCGKAIPCVEIWANLKERKLPVPNKWSSKCQEC